MRWLVMVMENGCLDCKNLAMFLFHTWGETLRSTYVCAIGLAGLFL